MKIIVALFLAALPICAFSQAQGAEYAFHKAAGEYIDQKDREARQTVTSALQRYPKDRKLNALKDKLKEDEKKKQQENDKQKEDQEKKDQNKDQQNKDQQDKKQSEKEKQEQKDQQQKDQKDKEQQEKEKKESEQKQDKDSKKDQKEIPPSVSEKLKDMQMSEDKARMILEAMKNQEIQYLQQNKRKATKPKDRGKPDW